MTTGHITSQEMAPGAALGNLGYTPANPNGTNNWSANQILASSGIAISSQNYPSYQWEFQRSTWNGSSAVTGTSYFVYDSSGILHWYNEAGTSVLQIDNSGNSTFNANIYQGSAGQYLSGLNIVYPATGTGQSWNVTAQGNNIFQVSLDGTNKIKSLNNVFDDGVGNEIVSRNLTVGSGYNSTNPVGGNIYLDGNNGGTGINSQRYYWQRFNANNAFGGLTNPDYGLIVYDGTSYYMPFGVDYKNKTIKLGNSSGWTVMSNNNVFDDGNGSAKFKQNISTEFGSINGGAVHWAMGNGTVDYIKLGLTGATSSGNAGANMGLWGYDDSGNFLGTYMNITRSTGAFQTKNNTVDDGTGQSQWHGNVNINNPAPNTNQGSYSLWFNSYDASSNHKAADIYLDPNGILYLNRNGSTAQVFTQHNTLDDGSGNMVTSNSFTANGGTSTFTNTQNAGLKIFETASGNSKSIRVNNNKLSIVNSNYTAEIMSVDDGGMIWTPNGQLGSASGTWSPANGTFNVAVGSVINIASVPSGAKHFHVQATTGNIQSVSGQIGIMTSSGSQWITIPGGTTTNAYTNSGYANGISSTNVGTSTLSEFYDGQYYGYGYFQINNGYLQFVVTSSGGNVQTANTFRWAVS